MNSDSFLDTKTVTCSSLEKNRYSEMLVEVNQLEQHGFGFWLFNPGMTFNSPLKWWGDFGQRDFPHEGIDICIYSAGQRQPRRIDEKNRIPVLAGGTIKAIFKDFLGKAIIVEHEDLLVDHRKLLSMYAHTRPLPHIKTGIKVKTGDVIATLADTRHSKAGIIPHLHFSLGVPSPSLTYADFYWNLIRDPNRVTLLNPLDVIHLPHEICDPAVPIG
jgi:murein DD-endopeptidase MepM/ murein hydrolase activator NlpD